jgi:uncharacterized membrane protein YeaQ/YmgE (transglycosylase-associated protein family)/uncharacterized protein YfkK (UPF0435 family)
MQRYHIGGKRKMRNKCASIAHGLWERYIFQGESVDPKIIAVIVGIVGAIIGVYFKEYLQSEFKKQKAISILGSNLFLFLEKIEANEQLMKFLRAGSILDSRYTESLKTGDDTKYKELLDQIESIEEHSKTNDLITDDAINEMIKKIKSTSKKEIEIIYDEIDRLREDIEHGTYILGRSEINLLDAGMIQRVFRVKRSINDILITAKLVIAGVYEREEIEPEYVKFQVLNTIKVGTLACRHVLPILKKCH